MHMSTFSIILDMFSRNVFKFTSYKVIVNTNLIVISILEEDI